MGRSMRRITTTASQGDCFTFDVDFFRFGQLSEASVHLTPPSPQTAEEEGDMVREKV